MPTGPRPNFFESDLLLALRLISQGGIGRHKLSEDLCLGEASGRSILTRLRKRGFVSSTSSGHTITKSGKNHLEKKVFFTMPQALDANEITVQGESMAFILRGVSERISDGLFQRDRAIMGEARGATTLVFERGIFRFPPSGEVLKKTLNETLKKKFLPRERDVLVIVSAPSHREAFRGCSSVLEGFL
jgi:hypothetical protein